MWTPKADWAVDTVVDTGITRSLELTGPGLSPSDDSSDDTSWMVFWVAPYFGPNCPAERKWWYSLELGSYSCPMKALRAAGSCGAKTTSSCSAVLDDCGPRSALPDGKGAAWPTCVVDAGAAPAGLEVSTHTSPLTGSKPIRTRVAARESQLPAPAASSVL